MVDEATLYRRPLPEHAIAFSSVEGRRLFAEALAAGGLDGYFPLAEQFHTQSEPAYCGLGSLVVALNALAIDPGRLWKGPWRWFGEELLDCCVPLARVRERGIDLDELACLARCNGADVAVARAEASNESAFRDSLFSSSRGESVLIVAYDRAALGQTGGGHFSPIGGYHAARDLVLVLDVARFKYPPHWVPAALLWEAMRAIDPTTGHPRGWMTLRPRASGLALGFTLKCDGESWQGLARRLETATKELGSAAGVAALSRAVLPLVPNLELRIPTAKPHQDALVRARAELRALPLYPEVERSVGAEHAELVTLLLLASGEGALEGDRALRVDGAFAGDSALGAELAGIRAQVRSLLSSASLPPA